MGTGGIPTTENIPETIPDSILSAGHPNISVVSVILSVVDIPPVPIPINFYEILSNFYDCVRPNRSWVIEPLLLWNPWDPMVYYGM